MARVMETVAIGVLVATLAFVALVAYWLLYPYQVSVIDNVRLVSPVVYPGEDIAVHVELEKFLPYPVTIYRNLINDYMWTYPPEYGDLPVGRSSRIIWVRIPASAPPGKNYQIVTTYEYQVNPIRTVRVAWRTEQFEVTRSILMP